MVIPSMLAVSLEPVDDLINCGSHDLAELRDKGRFAAKRTSCHLLIGWPGDLQLWLPWSVEC